MSKQSVFDEAVEEYRLMIDHERFLSAENAAQDNCFTLAPSKNVQILEMECVSGTDPWV